MVARQAHNLEVDVFKSILRNQTLITVLIQCQDCFLLFFEFDLAQQRVA